MAIGLLAAAGCNQIWGLQEADRIPEPSPDWPRIRLTAQVAQTSPVTGNPDQNLVYVAIQPPPAVQIGELDGPLLRAEYETDGQNPGRVGFPPELLGMPWRLAYTLADGVPHEVHWAPASSLAGHLVEPLLGRVERAPVQVASGYTITPPNLAAGFQHTASRVFTTGVWTEGSIAFPPAGRTFDYGFDTNARPLSGLLGAPESAKHDYGLLADFKTTNGCRVASGTATFPVPDLVAGSLAAPSPQPTYFSADKQVQLSLPVNPAPIHARLQTVLGSRDSGVADAVRWEYGYAPSLGVSGFSKPAGAEIGEFLLTGPRMIALASCSYSEGSAVLSTPAYADSPDLRMRFPRVVHVEVVDARTVNGVSLSSGFAGVVTATGDIFTSDFAVTAATGMALYRGGAQIADLADGADGQEISLDKERLELKFAIDAEMLGLVADYFDITLYALANGKLDRRRVYTVTKPSLTIDPAVLDRGTEYVFEIRSYRGQGEASRADFSVNSYPQYAAAIFTRTFRTP